MCCKLLETTLARTTAFARPPLALASAAAFAAAGVARGPDVQLSGSRSRLTIPHSSLTDTCVFGLKMAEIS